MENQQVRLEDRSHAGTLRIAPVAQITVEIKDSQIILDGSLSQPVETSPASIQQYSWSARQDNPEMLTIIHLESQAGQRLEDTVHSQTLVVKSPRTDGEYYLTLSVVDEQGREDRSTTYFTVENGQPVLKDMSRENTAWVDRAVVYGLIPRNFPKPGFVGITGYLDRLQALGINAVWLSPVNQTPLGNYGYHVMDYFELEEAYGTKDDFRGMVVEAHRRGIRVLMDFVPNHTTEHHRYFEDTIRRGKESPYWDFYDRDENGAQTNYFHWSYLPNLNFSNPKVVRWITEAFAYWVREFDVDGFRVDVAWGIRQRNPEFWPELRKALQRIRPDLLLLAEASARDSYYFTDGFDSAYDWTDELGHGAWEHVFEDRSLLCDRLRAALTNQGRGFHLDALIFRFLNNNDTGARFITRYGVAMTRVATAMLLTLPGLPCIYLGDETGTEFLPYKTRQPFDWSADPHDLLNLHRKLIALRQEIPALYSRSWQLLNAAPGQKVFAYLRWGQEDDRSVLVLLNFFDSEIEVSVEIPEDHIAAMRDQPLEDLLTGQQVGQLDSLILRLTIPPMSSMLLSPKSHP